MLCKFYRVAWYLWINLTSIWVANSICAFIHGYIWMSSNCPLITHSAVWPLGKRGTQTGSIMSAVCQDFLQCCLVKQPPLLHLIFCWIAINQKKKTWFCHISKSLKTWMIFLSAFKILKIIISIIINITV